MIDISTKLVTKGVHEGSYTFESEDNVLRSVDNLPAGIYEIENLGTMFTPVKLIYKPIKKKEAYINVTGGTVLKVMTKLEQFFSEDIKTKYAELGIMHKTGLILYGIPGTGKTVTSHIIMENLVKHYNAICLVVSGTQASHWRIALQELAMFNRPIVFFADECENTLGLQESSWLTFLDGHQSIANFIFLGCTNYIDKLSPRIKRPSRIEHLIEVSSIEESVAKEYVASKVGKLDANVRSAMVHFALENKATIDAFKNAIKDFYIYTPKGKPEEFEVVLNSYIEREKKEAVEVE